MFNNEVNEKYVSKKIEMTCKEDIDKHIKSLNESLIEAATEHVEKVQKMDREFKRSAELEQLFSNRKKLYNEGKFDEAKTETKKIRKTIKQERTDLRIKHLEEELWFDVKKAKRGFVPSHTKMSHKDGRIAKSNEKPEILAEYFGDTQWKKPSPQTEVRSRMIFNETSDIKTRRFDMTELINILKKLKNSKSPGPDGIPVEFFKWLNAENLELLLEILNACWEFETIPSEMELANVITLYKKGKVDDPANYRPISLLNTTYKIYASLIQTRLAEELEKKIWKSQFGFRKSKSTQEALFILRRIQDFAETSGEKLFLVFLDWEKAFDKVDQVKLVEAMKRLNIPDKITRILESFYVNPQFRIKDPEGLSKYRKQKSGIRQGCPLSPYLFICLMTVLFHDVHNEVDRKIVGHELDVFNMWELLYADDTLLVGTRAREINIMLDAIVRHSAYYNMRLNQSKCEYIAMNGKADIHFADGKKLTEVQKATYLGGCQRQSESK